MAKKTSLTVVLLEDFAGKKKGETFDLGKEIAVSVVKRGIAVYEGEKQPEKEIKFKTSKKKKDEKNIDDTAV